MHSLPRHPYLQRLMIVWNRLTEPLLRIDDPIHYQRSRLLASLLLVALILLLTTLIGVFVFFGPEVWASPSFRTGAACLPLVGISYVLSRYGRFQLALALMIAQGFINTYLLAITLNSRDSLGALYFLTPIILFASPFVSVTWTLVMFGIQFVMLLVAPQLIEHITLMEIFSGPGIFAFVNLVIITLITHHRNRLETERQRQLRVSEERYRTISESFSDYAYGVRYDPERGYEVEWITESFTRITGYAIDDLRDSKNQFFLYEPTDLDRVNSDLQQVLAGKSHVGEYRIKRKDGEIRWLRLYRRPAPPHPDGMQRYFTIAQDITDRIRSQEALRNLANEMEQQARLLDDILSATTDMIGVFDDAGRLTYVNRAGLDLFQYQLDDVVAKEVVSLATLEAEEASLQALQATVAQVFKVGEPFTAEFSLYPPPDREARDYEAVFSPIHDREGQTVSAVVVARDITQRRQEEAQKLKLALERERLSVLSKFFQAISHDFRTSLSIIETNRYLIQMTLDAETRDKLRSRLDRIQENVLRLNSQLDNLSIINSLTSPHTMPCQLNRLAADITEGKRAYALHKQQTLTFTPWPDLPPVTADCRELQRAIQHLLTNAINYTEVGGTIALRTYQMEREIALEIRDTGVGIAPEYQTAIFDLFYRVDDARSIHSGGVGLGLSIAKMIVDAHGGRITVESTPGEGSTFTLILPLQPILTS